MRTQNYSKATQAIEVETGIRFDSAQVLLALSLDFRDTKVCQKRLKHIRINKHEKIYANMHGIANVKRELGNRN